MLAEIGEELLREFPENASALGLDIGARAGLKACLTDRSSAGHERRGATAAARLAQLEGVDCTRLSATTALDLAVVKAAHELAVQGYRFPYGDVVVLNQLFCYRNSPYVVTQNTGAFVEIPDLLESHHAINSAADAETYVQRLIAYAGQLDGETERLKINASLGVFAPAFLLDKARAQMVAWRTTPVADWGLIKTIERQATSDGTGYIARAEEVARTYVVPALDRQISELVRHRRRATNHAGVWKLPDGEAYYAFALEAATTSRMSADEVHRLGLEELRYLQGQMEPLLHAQGLSRGTVGQRMAHMGRDPKNLFPNTDDGRAAAIGYINGLLTDIRGFLPLAFETLVPGRVTVKRVPVEIEAGAPGGYAAAGTVDGAVPGNYYINLRDTSIWPRYALPTLTYHEAIPGHIWQGEYTHKLPLIRSLLAFNAYSEGWALYAEQLADELGAYNDNPLSRLGYLHSLAFRACRLVVDTGLHAKRWTRDYAIQWFAETNGSTLAEVTSEVDRYCAWPGQACGYKVGHSEINRLRRKAETELGSRYDYRTFNGIVVQTGGVPLTTLGTRVDAYIAAVSD